MNNTYANSLYQCVDDKNLCAYELLAIKNGIDKKMMDFFTLPSIALNDKKAIIDQLPFSVHEIKNLLKILIDDKMFKYLDDIINDYKAIYLEANNIKIVNITVSKKLDTKMYQNICNELETIFSKNVVIKYNIDPEIIGGILIAYDDKVIDNTIKNKLQRLEKAIRKEV